MGMRISANQLERIQPIFLGISNLQKKQRSYIIFSEWLGMLQTEEGIYRSGYKPTTTPAQEAFCLKPAVGIYSLEPHCPQAHPTL